MAEENIFHKNEKYWDNAASSVFKADWVHELHNQITEFLQSHVEWLGVPLNAEGKATKMMDYACGNGIVSRALHHLFAKCVGVDLAEGMVNEYRATIAELGAGAGHMIAVRGNLVTATLESTTPPLSEEELNGFDLVAICMTLHHIEDIELATKRLAERLRPGGVLLVIDWAKPDEFSKGTGLEAVDHGHPSAHTIAHHSFSKEQMSDLFEKAGCGESRFEVADRLTHLPTDGAGLDMQMFWARATKL